MLHSVFTSLASLLALTSAHPFVPSAFDSRYTDSSTDNGSALIRFTPNEIHNNVLAGISPDRITTSSNLYEYMQNNSASLLQKEDKHIYLRDTRTWVTLEDLTVENNTLESRQGHGPCFTTVNREVLYAHAYWAPWHAISSCLKSGANPAGGYVSVGYEDSVAVSYSTGLTFGGFEGAIGISVGFEITYGYAESSTFSCNVKEADTVQLWARHRQGWASVRSQNCRTCPNDSYCPDWKTGYVNAASPGSNTFGHQWGCSAQSKSNLKDC